MNKRRLPVVQLGVKSFPGLPLSLLAALLALPLLFSSCTPYYGSEYYDNGYGSDYHASAGGYGGGYTSALFLNTHRSSYSRCSRCGYNPCWCRSSYNHHPVQNRCNVCNHNPCSCRSRHHQPAPYYPTRSSFWGNDHDDHGDHDRGDRDRDRDRPSAPRQQERHDDDQHKDRRSGESPNPFTFVKQVAGENRNEGRSFSDNSGGRDRGSSGSDNHGESSHSRGDSSHSRGDSSHSRGDSDKKDKD